MNNNDLKKIGQLIDDRLSTTDQKISKLEKRIDKKLKITEKRLEGRIKSTEERLNGRFTSTEEKIIGEIGEFMRDQLFPILDEKADKSDIERLERKLDVFSEKVTEQGNMIATLHSLPSIAHELKLKKKQPVNQ